jgi:hypothetical protein
MTTTATSRPSSLTWLGVVLGGAGRRPAALFEALTNRAGQDHRRGACETGWLRVHGLA